jgi:ketosteroid isomerase-like protein
MSNDRDHPATARADGADHERLTMTSHTTISPQEAADRLAIRELVDAYAHCADRRDAKGQMALFTEDTGFLVFYDLTSEEPSQELHGRESLAPVFDDLNQYVATMHFNGQSTVSLDGDRAAGESYCLAHHLSVAEDGQRTLMVASIRYLDEFVKQDGQWLFAERRLMVNWIDTRPSTALRGLVAAPVGPYRHWVYLLALFAAMYTQSWHWVDMSES